MFFDHFGPAEEPPDTEHDVRPHPHIGLATVTYLFEGAIQHRDSIGSDQVIRPGAVNWMSAGRGIVHSERRPDALRGDNYHPYRNHGLQLWAALPLAEEESAPCFHHAAATDIPELQIGGATIRVLVGAAMGARSPIPAIDGALFLDVSLAPGALLELPALAPELAVYAIDSGLVLDGEPLPACTMAVLAEGQGVRMENASATLESPAILRCVVIGGLPLDAPRHLWWNFVSSDPERIARAAADWKAQSMGHVPGDGEFIPLPDRPLPGAYSIPT
jgi:redox-sensitive bicupin YhaK (pirin superfamily)